MMKNRMKRKLSMCLFALIILSGCWDNADIEDISFVMGYGFDNSENEENAIKHTTQLAVTKKKGEQGAAPQGKMFQNITLEGSSIQDIIRSLSLQQPNPVFTDHLESVILNQETAKTYDLAILLDQMLRDNITRLSPYVVLSKQPASEILNTNIEGEIPSSYISTIFDNETSTLKMLPGVRLGEVAANLSSQKSFALPNVKKIDNTVMADGAGVVDGKERKLVGFLTMEEVEGVNWLSGKGKAGLLEFKDNENNTIVYEVQHYNTKVKPTFQHGAVSFQVQVNAEGWITEDWSQSSHNLSERYIERLEKLAAEQVQELMTETLHKVQKKYKVDVVDFSDSFRIAYPKEFNNIKKNWDDYFAKADVSIKTDVKIINTGDVVK
ncbi:Ger(x)C family spore germination protein [Terribacillus saccharophilus]|uniref:Ger(x)C family spore germination protein n=1 Tax=Terribacillus saccharophilus TaxID=361277 RepID=UPI003982AA25